MQQTVGSCDTDTTVKAIGQNDCGIDLSSANGYDGSLVILNEDMRCTPGDDTESAIAITALRITLDCQGHKIEKSKWVSIWVWSGSRGRQYCGTKL